ncbi:hypothetical protein EKO27_g8053 [Xylaria grammica]|uniref:Pentacotripeptide-repeat region of PRORP domain-containing protein n=1 Tax=Xylaria grammica TaxID=363999 RepID=A0A439CXU9_9PEZI|nr:hypothetical protein EKO27_g8053 [Xylaria grammica]
MPPLLPLPSKAAIRALRGIALGTSCALGAILEDRRRRISTLKTAVANKQKIKSSKQYRHDDLEQLPSPLDDAAAVGSNLQWHERGGNKLREHHHHVKTTDSESAMLDDIESQDPFQDENISQHVQLPESPLLQPSESQTTFSQYVPSRAICRAPSSPAGQPPSNSPISRTGLNSPANPSAFLQQREITLITFFESLLESLESTDEDGLDQAISLFMSNSPVIPTSPLRTKWLILSARLSQECRASGRWENASRILATIIKFGPLDETIYFAFNPSQIIGFHLRRPDSSTPCSTDSVTSAAKLFLPKLEKRLEGQGGHMEDAGKLLVVELLASQRFTVALHIYWRMLGWAKDPEHFICWAIEVFSRHGDHKNVMKIFLLHYSRLEPSLEGFIKIMDYVVDSVEAMKGLHANAILEAFAQMRYPGDERPHTRWIMKLLRAHWARHRDISKTKALFEKVGSVGLTDRIGHPEGLYRTVIEIAVKVGDEETAHSYADKVIDDYPYMEADIALKLAVLKAKAGDWDGVLATFRRVQPNELYEPTVYDDAFLLVLREFAKSHPAAETRDFAMLFVRDMGIGFHPYMVTLIAKSYGEARDMKGFMAWLVFCSQEGFALDAGFCNSVLYNCWAKWKFSFVELRMIHAKFKALNPQSMDEVTHRIMSQAAHRQGNRFAVVRPGKTITVNKLAYLGRTTNKRDIFEAMNQEVMNSKPMAAVTIYNRAISHGMPFCSHCFRLAVLAKLRGKDSGYGGSSALSMIQDAHAQGHEVGPAVSTLIRHQIDTFHGDPEDVIIHMQNLITRFESSQITIDTSVLTHMAVVCVKIGQHGKAIALCHLARDRSGSPHLCFSLQGCKALASAYWYLLDIGGMKSLIDDLSESEFSTDKEILLHLKSIRRLVKKVDPSNAKMALLEVIERGVKQLTQARAEARTRGKVVSQETLRIVGDALTDLQKTKKAERGLGILAMVTHEPTDGSSQFITT